MKTYQLLCLATLLTGTLHAQTPARKPTPANRRTTTPSRAATTPAKPAADATTPSKAPVAAPPAPAPAQRTQPAPTPSPAAATPASTARKQVAQPDRPAQQEERSSIQFGIVAGATLASINYSGTDGNQALNIASPTRVGFHVGVLTDIPLSSHLSVQPSLLYVMKGSSASTDNSDVFNDLILSYVELPLTLFYKVPAGANSVRIGFGGYAAYGLSGSYTASKTTIPIEFGSGEGQLNPLDFGIRGAVQFQTGSLLLGASYSYGLGNLINKADNEALTHRAIHFSAGYILGGKR